MDNLEEKMTKIEKACCDLHTSINYMGERVAQIEGRLVKSLVGPAITSLVCHDNTWEFVKEKGGYRYCMNKVNFCNLPRDQKIIAWKHLPLLLEKIYQKIIDMQKELENE